MKGRGKEGKAGRKEYGKKGRVHSTFSKNFVNPSLMLSIYILSSTVCVFLS